MVNRRLFKLVFLIQFVFLNDGFSQIPDYSQIHTNYIYINPAFTGIKNCPQLYSSYRNKYSSIDGGYSMSYISYDMYLGTLKSDVGICLLQDIQGNLFFTTGFWGIYAKEIQLKKKLFLRMGVESGYIHYGMSKRELIFSDMLDVFDDNLHMSDEDFLLRNKNIFDVETGFLIYNEFFFSGFTIKHLQDGMTKKTQESNRFGRTFSFHSGGEFSTTKAFTQRYLIWFYPHVNVTISPTSSYTQIGVVAQKTKVQFGLGYRQNFPWDAESFIVFVGFVEKKFKFAYNCDISINSHIENNANTHEVSFSYQFDCKEKRKKYEAVKAPIF